MKTKLCTVFCVVWTIVLLVPAPAPATGGPLLATGARVAAWGDNRYGQLRVPPGLWGVTTAIAGGGYHGLALKENGTVAGWGDNSEHQTSVPPGLKGATAIAAGDFHSLALKVDGTVVASM